MSTNYPADFPAEQAFDPVQPDVFLWVDPLIIGALLLAALAIGLFGWWLGRNQASHDPDAAEDIWKAIDDAAKAAMKADNHAIPGKAQALRDVIDKKLGRTLKLAGGLKLKALDEALKGRGPADGHGHSHAAAHGGHGAPPATEGGDGHGGSPAAAANVTIVTVTPPAVAPHAGHAPHHPEHRDLTADERNDALRLAVAAINEHWRHKADRIAAIRAAHAELSGH